MEIIVFVGVSLDGFIARADGSVDFLDPSEAAIEALGDDDMGFGALLERVDALLMGRNSFDFVMDSGFDWPYGDTPVYVATHRPLALPDDFEGVARSIEGTPEELVAHLEREGVRVVYADGGDLVEQFLTRGLVDELTLTVVPRLIGSGISLFGPLDADMDLTHTATTTYPNGYVQLTYRT